MNELNMAQDSNAPIMSTSLANATEVLTHSKLVEKTSRSFMGRNNMSSTLYSRKLANLESIRRQQK